MKLSIEIDEYEQEVISNIRRTGRISEDDIPAVHSVLHRIGDEVFEVSGEQMSDAWRKQSHPVEIDIREFKEFMAEIESNQERTHEVGKALEILVNKYGPTFTIKYMMFWFEAYKSQLKKPQIVDILQALGKHHGLIMRMGPTHNREVED